MFCGWNYEVRDVLLQETTARIFGDGLTHAGQVAGADTCWSGGSVLDYADSSTQAWTV